MNFIFFLLPLFCSASLISDLKNVSKINTTSLISSLTDANPVDVIGVKDLVDDLIAAGETDRNTATAARDDAQGVKDAAGTALQDATDLHTETAGDLVSAEEEQARLTLLEDNKRVAKEAAQDVKDDAATALQTAQDHLDSETIRLDGEKETLERILGLLYTLSGDNLMIGDTTKNNFKCGNPGSSSRLFDLRNERATENLCKQSCTIDPLCVAFSGEFNGWCVGCSKSLDTEHPGAIAFKKQDGYIDISNENGCRCDESKRIEGKPTQGLAACKDLCTANQCVQIGWKDQTNWCNLYDKVCEANQNCLGLPANGGWNVFRNTEEEEEEQQQYILGPKTGCDGGQKQISNPEDCQKAAETLGVRYWGGKGGASAADPTGCIYRTPDQDVYFNTHSTGSLNRNDRKLVCTSA